MNLKFILITSLALISTPLARAQEIEIFNGRDLTGWEGLPDVWSVRNGAITGELNQKNHIGTNTFLVWSGGEVADFEFSCKYKLKADNPEGKANSGIQFRAFMDTPNLFGLKGYQAELDPGTNRPPKWPAMINISGCLTDDPPGNVLAATGQKVAGGAVIGSLGTNESAAKFYRKNDWNDIRIIAVGNRIQTFINGLQTADLTDNGGRYTSGLLGLQIHGYGKPAPKTVQFKDLRLKRFQGNAGALVNNEPATTSPAALPAIETDPNQPILETLSQHAPNAMEWALAPLDQPVPDNIRQNLTFLREDLLDEAKQDPKGSPEAYRLGTQMCDNLLVTFEARHQALAHAGFRAVEAEASTGVNNQALNARRNYKMSWPQYARERDQRAELKSQATNQAEVMKERPKMEWATRNGDRRRALDLLYRQFRDALRQDPEKK